MACGPFSKWWQQTPPSSHNSKAPAPTAKKDFSSIPQRPQAAPRSDPGHKRLIFRPRPGNDAILAATLNGLVDLQHEQNILDSFDRGVFIDRTKNLPLPGRVVIRPRAGRSSSPAPSSIYSRPPHATTGASTTRRVDSAVSARVTAKGCHDHASEYRKIIEDYGATPRHEGVHDTTTPDEVGGEEEEAVDSAVEWSLCSKSGSESEQQSPPLPPKTPAPNRCTQSKRISHLRLEIPPSADSWNLTIAPTSSQQSPSAAASSSPTTPAPVHEAQVHALAQLERRLRHLRKLSTRAHQHHRHHQEGTLSSSSQSPDSLARAQLLREASAQICELRHLLGLPLRSREEGRVHPA